MKVYATILCASLALALFTAGLPTRAQNAAPQEALDLSAANNTFGIELFKKLHTDGQNTFISPTSIGMALQMTSRGAKGETLSEMNNTMHVEKLQVGDANRKLLDALAGRDDVKLNIANSIWADPIRIKLDRKFADKVQTEFDAEVRNANFTDPKAKETINNWVSERTEKKIPELIDELGSDTVCVLINAIYFKGEWTAQFDERKTEKADFTRADGSKQSVQMMNSPKRQYRYLENDDMQVVAMPYGPTPPAVGPSGPKEPTAAPAPTMHMWLVLPRPGKSLDGLVDELSAESFKGWQDAAANMPGTVALPRFKMKFKAELQDTLPEMGMKLAFTNKADFNGFEEAGGRGGLYISAVIHEAMIEVNEEGTEAAAATAVKVARSSPSTPPKEFSVKCDRPFLLAIVDDRTGSMLFVGAIHNPEIE